ncbi:DUF2922 domain-containing protein [Tepidibacter mesophilus]|uniref:DUF2922 domain-containing protein n=1 Tax=Tepidibacter mesophilus TaxID=655607 RepID=UPI000C08B4BE|nr:DUF2922 domain-containing protein [Tepidibacter mesophilus]
MKTGTINRLYMIFKDGAGDKVTLRVDDADPDVDDSAVEAAMKTIVDKNIFNHNGEDIKEILEAKLAVEQVQEIHLTNA